MTTDREKWAAGALVGHNRLAPMACRLLEAALKDNSIDFLSISFRVKLIESIVEKIDRKNYRDYKLQLTDISGVRVVCFLESDIVKVEEVVKELFDIDYDNSLDRSKILGLDRIGYRSVHYVCSLGNRRSLLREYRDLCDLKFEIQIRTVLQHAWAELAHDRSFKFRAGLPATLERRLNLYAGMLEVIDQGFDAISGEIDEYNKKIESKTSDEILDLEISSQTVRRFISNLVEFGKIEDCEIGHNIIKEMRDFGISKVSDLKKLIDASFIASYKKHSLRDNCISFVRHAMMYRNIDKYFSTEFDWKAIDQASTDSLSEKYGNRKVNSIFEENGIEVIEDYFDDDEDAGVEF